MPRAFASGALVGSNSDTVACDKLSYSCVTNPEGFFFCKIQHG